MYDIDRVRFVFEHYTTLARGNWPDPKNDDSGVRVRGVSYHAPYENPVIMAAEIDRRVRQCGADGLIVEMVYGMLLGVAWGAELYAAQYHNDLDGVYTKINTVAWYCTDEEFYKYLPYGNWKSNTRNKRFRRG